MSGGALAYLGRFEYIGNGRDSHTDGNMACSRRSAKYDPIVKSAVCLL